MSDSSRVCGKCKKDKQVKGPVEMRAEGQRGVYVCPNGHQEEMTAAEQMGALGYKPMF